MAKNYPVGFRVLIPEPVEVKMITRTIEERDSIDFLERYPGLFTYCIETDTFYYLSKGVENDHWKPLGSTPDAVIITDNFTDQPQTIISGYGIKNYLLQNYYTNIEIDEKLEALKLPDHIASITPEDVTKLKTIQGDISLRVDFSSPSLLWVVPHPPGKSCNAFNESNQEIFGQKNKVSDVITTYGWSKPIVGYVLIN
jgi:hypothetical protein